MIGSAWIKCDASCPAQAQWLVKLLDGPLYFCGHHKNKYQAGLDKVSYDMVDLQKIEEVEPENREPDDPGQLERV